MSRIAFISTLADVPWGGSEALWLQTALCLRARGHKILANVQWWPETPKALSELEHAGATIQTRRRSTLDRLRDKVGRARPDTQWLEAARPDIAVISLHCHGAGLEWMQACAARKIPYVVVVHAVVDYWWPADEMQQPLAQSYNQATALYFVSNGNHRQVSIQLADDLGSARVVRNPFNVDYNAAPAWPADGSTLRLACVGRIDPGNKGQDILLRVLATEKWKSRAVQLTFFGDGPHRESVLALRDYLGLQDKVESGGFTPNVETIWKNHHALALTSRAEGLPIVIVEAMLCARPCLVTDVAGNAELIEDNVSGFVAKAPAVEFVDEALERLWQIWQDGKLQSCGQKAAVAVRENVPENPAAVFGNAVEVLLPALTNR